MAGGGDGLSLIEGGVSHTVLFDRSYIRVGTQIVQVVDRELSGITVDEVELMSDLAWGGPDVALDGVDVDSKGHATLEGNDVPARDAIPNLRNGEKGRGCGKNGEEEGGESEELLGKHARNWWNSKEWGPRRGVVLVGQGGRA